MILPEDDESIFELFVEWLYHKCYDITSISKDPIESRHRFIQPVKLFVLADKYYVRSLKNLIVSQIFHLLKHHHITPSQETVAYAYENTPQDSTIRRLLVDHWTCEVSLGWFLKPEVQTWFRDHPDISADALGNLAKHTRKRNNLFDDEMPEDYTEKE